MTKFNNVAKNLRYTLHPANMKSCDEPIKKLLQPLSRCSHVRSLKIPLFIPPGILKSVQLHLPDIELVEQIIIG